MTPTCMEPDSQRPALRVDGPPENLQLLFPDCRRKIQVKRGERGRKSRGGCVGGQDVDGEPARTLPAILGHHEDRIGGDRQNDSLRHLHDAVVDTVPGPDQNFPRGGSQMGENGAVEELGRDFPEGGEEVGQGRLQ